MPVRGRPDSKEPFTVGLRTSISARVARQLRRKQIFNGGRDWAVDAYSRLLHNYPGLPLPGRHRSVLVRLARLEQPIYIRLGSSDHAVVSELFDEDEYGWVLPHLTDPVRTIIDIGGNIGLSVRFWYEHCTSLESVTVVEPDRSNLSVLGKNVEGLRPRPHAVQACVVARHRPIGLRRGASATAFTMSDAAGSEHLPTVTVEELVRGLPDGTAVDLLKCDIEGAEQEVFAAADAWLPRIRNIVIEVHGEYTVEHLKQDICRTGVEFAKIVESPHRPAIVGLFGNRV